MRQLFSHAGTAIFSTFIIAACGSSPSVPPDSSGVDRDNPKYITIYDVFSRYDTNTDSFLDRHEFNQFQLDPAIIAFRKKIPESTRTIPFLFEEIDEDGDERISLTEITVIAEGAIQ